MKKSKYSSVSEDIFNSPKHALKQLAALFPGAVKDGAVDFSVLKEELGHPEEVGTEKYGLTWTGKQDAKKLAQEDILGRTLRYVPEESKNSDTTQNLYIEGDNLEVLKLLRQNYYAAIKMIYIDPPYNTGNDFVYRDNFTQNEMESEKKEGNISEEGERLVRNQRSTNRFHANWLNMIYPRLRIARDLLTEDGVIFISIDDNEVANLREICDEIFSEQNFLAQLVWKSGRTAAAHFTHQHEYLLVYAKQKDSLPLFKFHGNEPVSDRATKKPTTRNPLSQINFPKGIDFECDDKIFPSEFGGAELIRVVSGSLEAKNGKLAHAVTLEAAWAMKDMIESWLAGNEVYDQKGQKVIRFFFKNNGVLQYEKERGTIHPSTIIDGVTTKSGSTELVNLFNGQDLFDFPKPHELIKSFITTVTAPCYEDIVLDFFCGSGTTGQSVIQANAEDNGNRRFILVQWPETIKEKVYEGAFKAGYKTISEIAKKRIHLAGDKVKAELIEKQKKESQTPLDDEKQIDPKSLDIGFKVFKTDDTMIRWIHAAINDDKTLFNEAMLSDKEKLDFMPYFTDVDVAYEILLRQHDIPLSAKMEQLTKIGKRTWCFADSYVVCLEEKITLKLVEKLAAIEPTPFKYIFRDSAFGDDIALKDETMRRLDANVKKNSSDKKKTYTVEFL